VRALDFVSPGAADMLALAEACRDGLPDAFGAAAKDVHIRITDYASDDVLDEFGIDDALELTGLYTGTPLTESGASDTGPAEIHLYRLPILFEWANTEGLALNDLIKHVYIHELGHHFGWSDEEMDALLDMPD
jgi:predicted Zn-dependent protease with MMP-like domain